MRVRRSWIGTLVERAQRGDRDAYEALARASARAPVPDRTVGSSATRIEPMTPSSRRWSRSGGSSRAFAIRTGSRHGPTGSSSGSACQESRRARARPVSARSAIDDMRHRPAPMRTPSPTFATSSDRALAELTRRAPEPWSSSHHYVGPAAGRDRRHPRRAVRHGRVTAPPRDPRAPSRDLWPATATLAEGGQPA